MAITTATEYKTYAGIQVTDFDTYLATAVTAAQELAEDEIGYTLDGSERTETYHGGGGQEIVLRGRPVVSVTSVKPVAADSTVGTAWAATDYKIDLDAGILSLTPYAAGRFPVSVRIDQFPVDPDTQFDVSPRFDDQFLSVQVVYKAGWGSTPYTTAPTRLKFALWRIIDALFLTNQIATGQAQGDRPDVAAVVREWMAPYRRALP